MSNDKPKPASNPTPSGPAEPSSKTAIGGDKSSGRVKFDDRGNAIWEWQLGTGTFGEVSTQTLKKLEHPALSIADDAPSPFETVRANPLGMKKGYDPYDSGKLGKKPGAPKKKDLRRLSEWLKLKKQHEGNKDEEPQD